MNKMKDKCKYCGYKLGLFDYPICPNCKKENK